MATFVDPICGMTVDPADAAATRTNAAGETVYFCSTGCAEAYDRQQAGTPDTPTGSRIAGRRGRWWRRS